jgi:hypothetical protein
MTAAFNQAIGVLGIPAYIISAKTSVRIDLPSVGFASMGKQDEALVNAYGVAAKVITIRADQIANIPEKFDTMFIGAERFVLAGVHPIYCGPAVIGYKCYAKGS